MPEFLVESLFSPQGDQPVAINQLVAGVESGLQFQTLEGITGSGKTATIAWMIERLQRPTLILEPNKSLAAVVPNVIQLTVSLLVFISRVLDLLEAFA